MKSNERDIKNAEKILDRAVTRHANLSQQDVDAAMDRAWKNLQPDVVSTKYWAMDSEKPSPSNWRFARLAFAGAAVLVVASLVIVQNIANRTYAVVETSDGEIYRAGASTELLQKGARIAIGDVLRSGRDSSVLSLTDGSRIELRSQSEFSVERAEDGIRIHLQKGGIIVNAAKQLAGHLYVQTKDVTVSVVGTVFLVNAEEEGSRVAVIEGEVRVQQGATSKNLLPGEQLSTSPKMESMQVRDELSWSRNAETHVALLQQTAPAPIPDAPKRLEFEAATIKPAPFKEIGMDIKCKGIDGIWSAKSQSASADALGVPQGRCTGIIDLGNLIRMAYGVTARRIVVNLSEEERLFEAYQLEGKSADVRTATKAQLQEMAQNLVLDRMKLRAHRETKEEDGYSLRIADGGVKFKETSEEEQNPFGTGLRMQPACYWCLKGNFSLNNLADILEYFVVRDKPVVNATGLNSIYDITLMLHRIEPIRDATDGVRGANGNGSPIEFDPSLAKALEDQLGLRWERGKIPIEHVVIDHFERPSPN